MTVIGGLASEVSPCWRHGRIAILGIAWTKRCDERPAMYALMSATPAVELGRSLLANHTQVPRSGLADTGVTAGGFKWSVTTRAAPLGRSGLEPGALQDIQVVVSWADGLRDRRIQLDSVVEGIVMGGQQQ